MIFCIFDLLKSEIYFSGFFRPTDFLICVLFGIYVLIGALCRILMFKKAGKDPLKALIPFYGIYEYYGIFWKGYYGIIQFILSNLFYVLLPKDVRLLAAGMIGYLCIALFVAKALIDVVAKMKLAMSFGKNLAFVLGLLFVEPVFILAIALGKCEYLGPTLREYNSDRLIDRKKIIENKLNRSNKEYMINLYKWRSITALIACTVTLVFTIVSIAEALVESSVTDEVGDLFKYFTVNSNILTALASGSIVPYAIEGIRKKRFSYPKWAALMHYSGTICTTLTMVFAVSIISWFDPFMAFGSHNFFLHIICPIAILISFMLVESDYRLNIDEAVVCLAPFAIYALIYTIEVFLIGKENGGWEDLYCFVTYTPISFSIPAMFMIALGVSLSIRKMYNELADIRKRKLRQRWPENADPVEIKIEAYGLGRYMGMHEEPNNASLPLDILEDMAQNYSLKPEEIIRAYNKGVIDGTKEKEIYQQYKRSDLLSVFGTPYRLSGFYNKSEGSIE